jgi:adenylate cyclase
VRTAANLSWQQRRLQDAARYYEKATALMDTGYGAVNMLATCYAAMGDTAGARRAAQLALDRAEAALALDRSDGEAWGIAVIALAKLGEAERAREWIDRALLVDPENFSMRYNLACALWAHLKDADAALDMLASVLAQVTTVNLDYYKLDPDWDGLRDDPRFISMIAAAEARLAASSAAESAAG